MKIWVLFAACAMLGWTGTLQAQQDAPKKRGRKAKKTTVAVPVLPEAPPQTENTTPHPATEASASEQKSEPVPVLSERVEGASVLFEKERYSFGKVRQGDLVRHTFRFVNNGSVDFKILDVKAACGCTVPSWPKNPIKPGESGAIEDKFNTAGKMGKQKKSVTVYSNVGEAPNNFKVLYLEGEVTSPVLPTIEIR
ncbi:MAG: DUF1573 domain-containing protein [Bacteroidia bacterium]|nr:DUF1573 domain-containing protein [Bacteroidia bacterium]MDW8333977.1 DUF1573 domain-containing protein [Bacteroidia bacterium]